MYPAQSITSAALGHVGQSPTGAMVGTVLHGMWADSDRTIPIAHGSMARSQIQMPQGADRPQAQSNPQLMNDLSWNARGTQPMNVPGETNLGKDFIQQIGQRIWDKAQNGANDSNIQYPTPKSSQFKSIGTQTFQSGQKILNLITQVDPQNNSGAISPAVKVMKGLKNLTDGGSSGLGGSGFGSLFNAAIQALSGTGGGSSGGSSGTSGTGGQSTAGLPANTQDILTALLSNASNLPVGPATSIESYVSTVLGPAIATAANDPTNNALPQPNSTINTTANGTSGGQGSGGSQSGGNSQAVQQAMQAIQSLLNSAFSGQGNPDGLGSFQKETGVIKSMESIFNQLKG